MRGVEVRRFAGVDDGAAADRHVRVGLRLFRERDRLGEGLVGGLDADRRIDDGVEAGALRQVVPSALSFSFVLLAQGSVAEGAALEVVTMPIVARCRACCEISEMAGFPLLCASCGGLDLEIVGGEELLVASLELEDFEDADTRDENRRHGGLARCQ